MKNFKKLISSLLVMILLVTAVLPVSAATAGTAKANTIGVTVTVLDYTAKDARVKGASTSGVIASNVKVNVPAGAGVVDAIEEAMKAKNIKIDVEDGNWGAYITGINGLSQMAAGYPYSGWMYSIDNDYNNYMLKHGSKVVVSYSLTGGPDVGSYYNDRPKMTEFVINGKKANVSIRSGAGTKTSPYVINVDGSIFNGVTAFNVKFSYKSTLNSHYLEKEVITEASDIMKVVNEQQGTINLRIFSKYSTAEAYYRVNVGKSTSAVAVKSVSLNKSKITLAGKKSYTLKATVAPSNAANKGVTWKSSKSSVAKVGTNGKVTGVKAGKAVITATTKSGKKIAKCTVTVKPVKAKKITLNKKARTIKKGKFYQLKATLKPSNTTDTVKWKTSNKKIATVSSKGVVKAKKKGKCTITARTTSGKKVTCKITVK